MTASDCQDESDYEMKKQSVDSEKHHGDCCNDLSNIIEVSVWNPCYCLIPQITVTAIVILRIVIIVDNIIVVFIIAIIIMFHMSDYQYH